MKLHIIQFLKIIILAFIVAGCSQNEEKKVIRKENEISTFLRVKNKDNSPYSIKILSNVKQFLNGNRFYKAPSGEIMRLNPKDKTEILPNVFYDFLQFKHIENPGSIIIDLTYYKLGKDNRTKISITISQPDEKRENLTTLSSSGSIYIPSNFEYEAGITSLPEEEVEQRIADYILKVLYRPKNQSTKKRD